jgi:phospholipid-binding lipoprotein MlaA
MRFSFAISCCLIAVLLASGCALKPSVPKEDRSEADPWEPLNRQIHGFNNGLDKVTFKPLAKGYQKVFPQFLRTGIRNFSFNLRAPLNAINHFLQGKGKAGLSETGRFVANSTFGLLGVLDVATDMGLERQPEDFGQTFAKWGIPDGPFVVLPVIGPRTLRGAIATPLNIYVDPLIHYDNASVRDKLYFIRVIDLREKLFAAESLLEGSQDRYLSTREAYLQNRLYLIFDGDPPVDDDLYEEYLEEDE